MSILSLLLNGQLIASDKPVLHADDRGFHYGDGIFETMLLQHGRVRFLEDHWQRMKLGCDRLNIPQPERVLLDHELSMLTRDHAAGVIKFILSRGRSERGYRPPAKVIPSRLWQLFPEPGQSAPDGITVRWCNTRLSRNPGLAGIKHCNRLEQVMALAEWQDTNITEGLMLDTEGELISATMNNVFLVVEETLVTPDLRYSGIQGVMRKKVLQFADQLAIPTEQRAVRAEEVIAAQEVFLTNSIRGIQPVTRLEQQNWSVGPLTTLLMQALESAS